MKRALGTSLIAAVLGLTLTHVAQAIEQPKTQAANYAMSEPLAFSNDPATLVALVDTERMDTQRADRYSMMGTPDANMSFVASVTPEPSSELALRPVPEPKAVMLLTGLGLLMFVGYRRSRL
jgi:hypothetical protein